MWKGNGALHRAPFEGVVLKRGAGPGPSKRGGGRGGGGACVCSLGRVSLKDGSSYNIFACWQNGELERKSDDARRNHRRNRVPWECERLGSRHRWGIGLK